MQRQRGQSAVEFALMAPIIFFMIFGMIYGGFMFMEYMHYSNAVRTAARQVAVTEESRRNEVAESQEKWLKKLWTDEVSMPFYEPTTPEETPMIAVEDGDVVVTIAFKMDENVYNSLPNILKLLKFPPRTIKTLQYHMKLEDKSST